MLSGPVNEQTQTFTMKVRVGSTCSRDVIGASVYVTAVPYNQFTIPAEELTGHDGTATLVFRRDANFPASEPTAAADALHSRDKAGRRSPCGRFDTAPRRRPLRELTPTVAHGRARAVSRRGRR